MTARPERQQSKHNPTREKVLDAALQVFAENGFVGATTKEIARRAKVNEVTLFRLFGSKKSLFNVAIVERSPLAQIKKAVSLDPKQPIDELLLKNVKTVLAILRSNRHLYMVMLGDAWRQPKAKVFGYSKPIQQGIEFLAGFIQSQIDAGRLRKVDPTIAARAWMGAIQFYFLTSDLIGGERLSQTEEDRLSAGLVDLFLNGMKGKGGD